MESRKDLPPAENIAPKPEVKSVSKKPANNHRVAKTAVILFAILLALMVPLISFLIVTHNESVASQAKSAAK